MLDKRWSLAALDPASRVLAGHFTASDGEAVPYRFWEAQGNARALVLLLHGAFDYSAAFDEMGPLLARHGYASLAYDQRGFGGTASRGKWHGITRMIRDVAELAAFQRGRCGRLPLFIIGESMGGAVALHAVARDADLDVAGLILVAPGALGALWRRLVVAALLRAAEWCMPRGEFICERLSGWELTPGAAIRLLVDPLILRTVHARLVFGLAGLARSAIDEAPGVRCPSLTLVGLKDDIVGLACMKQLFRHLTGPKQWEEFEGGPHLLLHWQHNERVFDCALAWMARQIDAGNGKSPPQEAHATLQGGSRP